MKIQDVAFLGILTILLMIRKPKLFVYTGLLCLILAIPLFAGWVFFTAERLTWYAAAFFLIFILISLKEPYKVK